MNEKNREYILELFKIVSTNSILVVNYKGKVKRLYCPFLVICKVDVPPLQKGNEYAVDAVKMTLKLEEVFIIEGRAYYFWYFEIKA
ncbi:MAG: hypothetical protein ACOX2Q_02025 [Dehalobacterium sp.]